MLKVEEEKKGNESEQGCSDIFGTDHLLDICHMQQKWCRCKKFEPDVKDMKQMCLFGVKILNFLGFGVMCPLVQTNRELFNFLCNFF